MARRGALTNQVFLLKHNTTDSNRQPLRLGIAHTSAGHMLTRSSSIDRCSCLPQPQMLTARGGTSPELVPFRALSARLATTVDSARLRPCALREHVV